MQPVTVPARCRWRLPRRSGRRSAPARSRDRPPCGRPGCRAGPDADPDSCPRRREHGDLDVVADHDRLVRIAGEDEHGRSPVRVAPRGRRRRPSRAGARRRRRLAAAGARVAVGSRAAQQELAVVAARAGEQRRGAERGVARERGLEVRARAVAPAGDGRGAAEQAVHGAGVAGEAPLDEAVGVGLELGVQAGARRRRRRARAAASASEAMAVSQSIVLGPGPVAERACRRRRWRVRAVAGVEIGERQEAPPGGRGRLAAARRSMSGSSSSRRPCSRRTATSWAVKCVRASGSPALSARRTESRAMPLGLVEAAREPRPHAAPGERGVPVERLLELGGDQLQLGVPAPRLLELAQLGEVVQQPVARQRRQLGGLQLAGEGERLLADPAALVRVLGVQQGGVPAHQRGGQRVRLARAAAPSPTASAAGLGRSLRGLREHEVLGQAREDPHAQHAVAGLERRRAPPRAARRRRRRWPPGRRSARRRRAPPAPAGRATPSPRASSTRLHERRARVGLAGLPASRAERQQHVAARRRRRPDAPTSQRDERALVVRDRVLVGVRRLAAPPRPSRLYTIALAAPPTSRAWK